MADNSKLITLRLDTKDFEADLKAALAKIPKQQTVQLQVGGGQPGAAAVAATAAPVALGGQPITGAAGYKIEPGVMPGIPEGLSGNARVRAELEQFTVALRAAAQAARDEGVVRKENIKATAAQAVEESKRQTAEARAKQAKSVTAARDESYVERAEKISALKIKERETIIDLNRQYSAEKEEKKKAQQEERYAERSQHGARLVEFERARMLAQGIPGLVNPLMGTQLSGGLRVGAHALGMYSQYQALGERHELRMARMRGGGGSSSGGVDASGAGAAIGATIGAAGGSAGAAIGSFIGMATVSTAQAVMTKLGETMDLAQTMANKMGGLQLQRAGVARMAGSGFRAATTADPMSVRAAALGFGGEEVVAADTQLAQQGGRYARFSREYTPGILASGGSIASMGAVTRALAASGTSDGSAKWTLGLLAGTTDRFSGARADELRSGFAQTMLESSMRGIHRGPGLIAGFQQQMVQQLGAERGNQMTQMYGSYQTPGLGGIRGALKQYADALQLGETMKGAKSIKDLLRNDEQMTLQQRRAVDVAGGELAMLGRGYSVKETEDILGGKGFSAGVDVLTGEQTAYPTSEEERQDRKAASIGARSELSQLTAVEENTAKVAEAQVKFVGALTELGDAMNSVVASMRNAIPYIGVGR